MILHGKILRFFKIKFEKKSTYAGLSGTFDRLLFLFSTQSSNIQSIYFSFSFNKCLSGIMDTLNKVYHV